MEEPRTWGMFCTVCDSYILPKTKCKDDTQHNYQLPKNSNLGSGYPYYDTVLDTTIESRGHKNKIMKAEGIIERG